MPAYGVSRGNPYQSLRHQYNPLRGNNTLNHNDYSSLHYQSTRNRHHEPQPTPTTNNQYTNTSSLHPGNPSTYNPYLSLINANKQKTHSANNPLSNLPDLSKTRLPPQPIATPPRTNRRSMLTQPTEQEQEEATTGWNFTAFGLLKSAWCKLVGTPSKKTNTSNRRESMSQPPQSPLHDQPPNPYRITSTIPENRPVTAPISRATHAPLVDEMAAIPVTPPQQTRPNPHTYLSQTSSNTATTDNNDDAKSHNTSGKTDGGSTAVISIHNLLQKTKLSPDDAAWLHSKIDQVTHDRYDGSLSYIGPTIRAGSQGLIQQMSFEDDAATVTTNRSGSIFSPVRQQKVNVIPSTTSHNSRYQPYPDNFRKRYHKKPNGVIHPRKRGRDELEEEEDEQMMESQHPQRKRMRITSRSKSSTSVRRKPFRDNYLRPLGPTKSFHKIASQHNDNEPRKPSTPKARSPLKQPEQPSAAQRNGFHFDKHENTNNKVMNPSQNVTRVAMVATVVNVDGLGSLKPSDASSSSENVDMEVDKKEHKPLQKRRKKVRSPLKAKKADNTINKIQKQQKDNDQDDDDDDLILKKKKILEEDEDDENVHKKMNQSTPNGHKKTTPSTPISDRFKLADQMIQNTVTNDEQKPDALETEEVESDVVIEDTKDEITTETTNTNVTPQTDAIESKEDGEDPDPNKDKEGSAESPVTRKGGYLMKIMRERKERYLAAYTGRLTRIYTTYQPSKVDKVEGFMARYGLDVDKLHDLYVAICVKYELKPCQKYDGSKHDPMPSKDEVEKRDKKTPEQTLSKTLNDKKEDKKEEKKSELFPGFKFVAPSATSDAKVNKDAPMKEKQTPKTNTNNAMPFSWGVGQDSKKNAVDTNTNNAPPTQHTFENSSNPFGPTNTAKPTTTDTSSFAPSNKSWGFQQETTQTKDKKDTNVPKDGDLFNGAMTFVMPNNMSFSNNDQDNDGNATVPTKDNNNNNNKTPNGGMFTPFATKPALGVSKTQIIDDSKPKNSKKRRASWDQSGTSWKPNNAMNDTTKPVAASWKHNGGGSTWNANNNDNKKPSAQNASFQWSSVGGTANNNNNNNNDSKQNEFPWNPNQSNEKKPSNDGFSWNPPNGNNNGFGKSFANNNNDNKKQNNWTAPNTNTNQPNGFNSTQFSTNNAPNGGGNSSGWNWGGSTNNNIAPNNSNNPNGMNSNDNNTFTFQPTTNGPTNASNNAPNGGSSSFFTVSDQPNPKGQKKRPIYRRGRNRK
eukprot:764437_1